MEHESQMSNEWIISIKPLQLINKRKAITACEQTINRHGRLLNFKKQKATQLKFSCEFVLKNITAFLSELQKTFSIENYISLLEKKIVDEKNASGPQIIILILSIAE